MIRHMRTLTGLLPQSVRFNLRRAFFSGNAATCPLCLNGIKKWAPHGGGADILDARLVVGGMRREYDRCPICHGCDRTRLMMLWLKEVGGVGARPARVLHVAPDYGLHLWLMRQPGVEYVGSDLDGSRYRHIGSMVPADLTALPFPDDRFHFVLCSHVLEYVPNDLAALRDIRRVLVPGGRALLLVPEAVDGGPADERREIQTPEERVVHFGQWDHVRLYTRELFTRRIEEAGLSVELFDPFGAFPEEAVELRLNPLERLRVAEKGRI